MTGQTYQVNYIVNVEAQTAQTAINSFKSALTSLSKTTEPLRNLQRTARSLVETLAVLGRNSYIVKIDTKPATQKLGKLVSALKHVSEEIDRINAKNIRLGNVGQPTTGKQGTQSKVSSSRASAPAVASTRKKQAVSSAPPSGYFGSGKSMTYYGKNAPVIPAPTGYSWTQQSALQVPKEFRKAYERANRQQTVARRIASEGTNSKMNQLYRESTNAVKDARRQVGHFDQLRQNHAYQALTANNEIGRIQQTLDQQKAQTASLIAQRKQLQSLYGSTNNQKLVPQIKAAKAGIATSLAQEQALQSQIAALNQTAQVHTQAAQQATRQQNAAMTRLRRETAINERHEKALARQRRFVTSHMNATAPFTTGWGLTKDAVPAPPSGTATTGSRRGANSAYRSRPSRQGSSTYRAPGPTNLGYKLWGPTPLPNNGGMAIDMLKGMGIAYGIAGIGTMVSNIVDQAAEYDNLMKTVENILKSHDTGSDFSSRFQSMASTVRNVGMETKFKVTEVADAAKFLAMAGLNTEAISQAMRPIADIALVGDTDLGQTADVVTNIMTAYNIAPSKMRNAADVMTNTFTMSNTTLTEIAEAYKYAASLLSAGGVSFEEATAAIGVLGDAGIKGSQAGTTMRTIMANIVNPTKKQSAAWDAIGISRYNKDGSRKDILQIFKELNEKNLDVDAFYKIFHKTAASGAVALASHVGKWEDVYLENFLAGGLSANLADAKKNTLQGLWAQLTSIFTDKGVTAFNGVQGQIRGMLTKAIGWLKSESATKTFKEVSKTLMEFVQVLIDATKWFVKFYNWFGPMIKAWAKFQLMIWPVVKTVTAFRSVFLALMGLRKVGYVLSALSKSFVKLGESATFATGAAGAWGKAGTSAPMSPYGFAAGSAMLPGLSYQQYVKAAKGLDLARPHAVQGYVNPEAGQFGIMGAQMENDRRISQYRKDRKTFNKRVLRAQGLNAVKGVGGMAVGAAGIGYGLHKMTDDNDNGWDNAAGAAYAIAGTAAMVGGPWGWGIAAGAAIIGGIMQVIGSAQQSNKIYGEIQEFAKQNAINNGIIAGSESQIMQYLEAQHTKYDDINKLVERRIELTAKLLGLQSGDNPMDASVGVYQSLMEKHKDLWKSDQLAAFNDIYQDKFHSNKRLINFNGAYYLTEADSLVGNYVNEGGRSVYKVRGKNGEEAIRVGNNTTNGAEAAFASAAATAEVMAPGGYYEKLVEGMRMNVAKYGLKGATTEEFNTYLDQITHANDPQYLSNLIGLGDIKDTDWNLERMLQDEQTRRYMWSQLEAIMAPMRQAYANFRSEVDAGDLKTGTLVSFLSNIIGNQPGLAIKDFNQNDIAGWYARYGYNNGTFNAFTSVDDKGIVHAYTAEDAAKMAASNMQSIIDAIKQSEAASEPAAIALMGFCNTLLTQAQAFTSASDELIDVAQNQEVTINGQLYRWNELRQLYEAIDSDGNLVYIQSQVQGLSSSFGMLGLSLGQDWNSGFNSLFSGFNSTMNYLNMLGNIKFGTPYIPPVGTDWRLGGGTSTFTGTGAGTSFSLGGGSSLGLGGGFSFKPFSLSNGFGFQGGFQNAFSRQLGGWRQNTLTLQGASNAIANGGGTATGFKGGTGNAGAGSGSGGNGGRTGTQSSDYKSHAKERAVPKQININIQNLMKVDSVDLVGPEKEEVLGRLKREVAMALYEAAADGTMMLNNLATT